MWNFLDSGVECPSFFEPTTGEEESHDDTNANSEPSLKATRVEPQQSSVANNEIQKIQSTAPISRPASVQSAKNEDRDMDDDDDKFEGSESYDDFDAQSSGSRDDDSGFHPGGFRSGSSSSKKQRTAFTPDQIHELERRFAQQKYLSASERADFASKLKLSDTQVISFSFFDIHLLLIGGPSNHFFLKK